MKKMFVTIFIFLFFDCNAVFAQDNNNSSFVEIIIVYNSGEEVKQCYFDFMERGIYSFFESEVLSYHSNGITMIPLRAFAEGFGYDIDYQAEEGKIIIWEEGGKSEWVFYINSATVLINGQTNTMQQAPIIRNDRAFIPLRYTSEFFGKYITGIDGESYNIWISSIQLLTEDDVTVETDNNYYDSSGFEDPLPHYTLKAGGQTYRGIKLGDYHEKVIELYGEPHASEQRNGQSYFIKYYTAGYPGTGDVSILSFSIKNEIVTSVGVGRP